MIGILFEELDGLVAVMNDEVVHEQNDFLPVIFRRLNDGLHELLDKGTEGNAVFVYVDAMQSFSGNVIDRTEAIPFLIGAGCHHLALRAALSSTAQDARQEIEINFIFKIE